MCDEDAERLRAERNAKRRACYLGQSGEGTGSGQGLQSGEPGKGTGSPRPAERRTGRRPGLSGSLSRGEPGTADGPSRPTMRRTGKSDWPTWRHRPPAVPPGSSPDERRVPFPPAAALPGFTALARTYAPWPVWSGSVDQARAVRRHAEEGRREACGTAPATSIAARTSQAATAALSATPGSLCCTR